MKLSTRLWWASRPVVWCWRLGYLDIDASRVALSFAVLGRAAKGKVRP